MKTPYKPGKSLPAPQYELPAIGQVFNLSGQKQPQSPSPGQLESRFAAMVAAPDCEKCGGSNPDHRHNGVCPQCISHPQNP
jgi:hypothetical protein